MRLSVHDPKTMRSQDAYRTYVIVDDKIPRNVESVDDMTGHVVYFEGGRMHSRTSKNVRLVVTRRFRRQQEAQSQIFGPNTIEYIGDLTVDLLESMVRDGFIRSGAMDLDALKTSSDRVHIICTHHDGSTSEIIYGGFDGISTTVSIGGNGSGQITHPECPKTYGGGGGGGGGGKSVIYDIVMRTLFPHGLSPEGVTKSDVKNFDVSTWYDPDDEDEDDDGCEDVKPAVEGLTMMSPIDHRLGKFRP